MVIKKLGSVQSFIDTCVTIPLLPLSLITSGVVFVPYCTSLVAILDDLLGVVSYISSHINVLKYLYAVVV